ncbi:MAG: histidinol phosphate phosphatase, partial [Proteobacteria bacterium]|nr:histidinol phosphate phosphatase [Pseudomonadota bacterium]
WEAASDYQITVVCNSDAHHPTHAMASIEECIHYAEELGLTIASDEQLGIKTA